MVRTQDRQIRPSPRQSSNGWLVIQKLVGRSVHWLIWVDNVRLDGWVNGWIENTKYKIHKYSRGVVIWVSHGRRKNVRVNPTNWWIDGVDGIDGVDNYTIDGCDELMDLNKWRIDGYRRWIEGMIGGRTADGWYIDVWLNGRMDWCEWLQLPYWAHAKAHRVGRPPSASRPVLLVPGCVPESKREREGERGCACTCAVWQESRKRSVAAINSCLPAATAFTVVR